MFKYPYSVTAVINGQMHSPHVVEGKQVEVKSCVARTDTPLTFSSSANTTPQRTLVMANGVPPQTPILKDSGSPVRNFLALSPQPFISTNSSNSNNNNNNNSMINVSGSTLPPSPRLNSADLWDPPAMFQDDKHLHNNSASSFGGVSLPSLDGSSGSSSVGYSSSRSPFTLPNNVGGDSAKNGVAFLKPSSAYVTPSPNDVHGKPGAHSASKISPDPNRVRLDAGLYNSSSFKPFVPGSSSINSSSNNFDNNNNNSNSNNNLTKQKVNHDVGLFDMSDITSAFSNTFSPVSKPAVSSSSSGGGLNTTPGSSIW